MKRANLKEFLFNKVLDFLITKVKSLPIIRKLWPRLG